LSNVSHDLRTPLTSIISCVELLKRPDLPEEERTSHIDILDQKSKRLKVLIDDLFEASEMASGHVERNRERIDPVQPIQQALAKSGAKAGDGGLEFRVKLPEEPVFAFVDGKKSGAFSTTSSRTCSAIPWKAAGLTSLALSIK